MRPRVVRKCARQVAGMLPKRENALGKPWEYSRSVKTPRGSRGNAPEGQKCAGEVTGMLPKVENVSGKPWECSHSLKTVLCRCQNFLAQAVIGIVGMTVKEDAVRAGLAGARARLAKDACQLVFFRPCCRSLGFDRRLEALCQCDRRFAPRPRGAVSRLPVAVRE